MEQKISKEEFDEFMKIKGNVRGMSLKNIAAFVLKERGEKGLRELEDTITNFGYPLKYRQIKTMAFYPIGLDPFMMVVAKKILNFNEEDFKKLGEFSAKSAIIVRLFMKYLLSVRKVADNVTEMWKKYYTVGNIKTVELNEEKKYMILRVTDFNLHSAHCQVLEGYFPTVIQLIVKKKVHCKETKCFFRGDNYHEYLLKW